MRAANKKKKKEASKEHMANKITHQKTRKKASGRTATRKAYMRNKRRCKSKVMEFYCETWSAALRANQAINKKKNVNKKRSSSKRSRLTTWKCTRCQGWVNGTQWVARLKHWGITCKNKWGKTFSQHIRWFRMRKMTITWAWKRCWARRVSSFRWSCSW